MSKDERRRLRDGVEQALGDCRLVYYGIRGGDAAPFDELGQLSDVICLTDAYDTRAVVRVTTLEERTGVRLDLDGVINLEPEAQEWLATALRVALREPSAVIVYRPNAIVTEVALSAGDGCRYLGLFDRHQAAFEYKPWVDRELSCLGVPTLGWRLIRSTDLEAVNRMLDEGPVVVRVPVSSGGAGIARVNTEQAFLLFVRDLSTAWVSISPFVDDATALNVGAVVWADATVTVHPASVQLVGIPELIDRAFGYCGNDFGAPRELPQETLANVERSTELIGRWLHRYGYLGAFGIDFLIHGDDLFFCEINARFQGSSRLSDRIARQLGFPGLALEHLAALLNIRAPRDQRRLVEVAHSSQTLAQAIFHNRGASARIDLGRAEEAAMSFSDVVGAQVVCPSHVACAHGGVLLRVTVQSPITTTGFSVHPTAALLIRDVTTAIEEGTEPD